MAVRSRRRRRVEELPLSFQSNEVKEVWAFLSPPGEEEWREWNDSEERRVGESKE
jgi:hypothetical protein